MRRFRLVIALTALLLVAGCQQQGGRQDVVLWTSFDGAELETLERRVEDFEQQSGHQVTLLKVPFPSYRNKVLVAGPALQGPDLLIAPHDWIGILETADLVAPIPQDVVARGDERFYPVALDAASYGGQVYLAPMMMECVVLVRNTELCPRRPTTLEELVEVALECQETHQNTLGFAYRLEDFYFTWAFLAGFGADFLEPFNSKELDLESLNFNTPGAVEGARWVADLSRKHGLVPPGMTNEIAVSSFTDERLGMMLSGPWNLGAIRQSGVAYSLEPIPPGPVADSSPFVGVTGVMLSRYAVDKPGVKELLAFLSSAETGALLCRSSGRAPTRLDTTELLGEMVTDPSVAEDLELFAEAARGGTPLPNHPAMAAVWPSMQTALELITTGQTEAPEEFERTTERVRSKIRFMME